MSRLLDEVETFEVKSRFVKGDLVEIDFYEKVGGKKQCLICDVETKDGAIVRYSFLDGKSQLRWFEEFFDIFSGKVKASDKSWTSRAKYSVKKV